MADESYTVAVHEACHAAARWCLGHWTGLESVQAWSDGGKTLHGIPETDGVRDAFAIACISLAPEAYFTLNGFTIPEGSTRADQEIAAKAIVGGGGSKAGAYKALSVVEQHSRKMVGTERFLSLVAALVPELHAKGWTHGPEVERLFRAHDPAGDVIEAGRRELHGGGEDPPIDPWYEVTDVMGRLVHRGASLAEAEAVQARTPRSMLVGSVYG